jgi:hypothetical protein
MRIDQTQTSVYIVAGAGGSNHWRDQRAHIRF